MFDNVGEKVKILAKVFCVLGIIGAVVMAIILFANSHVGIGFLCLIAGSISSWITSLVIYAVGEAAENSEIAKAESSMASRNAREAMDVCKNLSEQVERSFKARPDSRRPAGTEVPEAKKPEEIPGLDHNDQDPDVSFHRFSKPVVCERCGKMFSEGYVVGKGRLSSKCVCERCYRALKGE